MSLVSADERMEQIFNQANEELLQRIKRSEIHSHQQQQADYMEATQQHSEYSYKQEQTLNYYDPIRLEDVLDADLPSLMDSSSLQHIFGDSRRNSLAPSSLVPAPPADFSGGYYHPNINSYWSRPEEEEDDDRKPKARERM